MTSTGPNGAEVQARDAPERFGHRVGADQAGNDDSRCNIEALVGEVNGLSRLIPLQLLDWQRMAINTAKASIQCASTGVDAQHALKTKIPFLAHSLSDNYLTNHGRDMSGVIQIAEREALKVNKTLQSIKYAA